MDISRVYGKYRESFRTNEYYISVGFIVGTLQALACSLGEPLGIFPTLALATTVFALGLWTANRIFLGNWSGRRQFIFVVPFLAATLSLTKPSDIATFAYGYVWWAAAVAMGASATYKVIAVASSLQLGMDWRYRLLKHDAAMSLLSWSLIYWGAVDLLAKSGFNQPAMKFAAFYPVFALFGFLLIVIKASQQFYLWRNWETL